MVRSAYILEDSDYLFSHVDDDNNMSVFNSVYSHIQDISIPKNSSLFSNLSTRVAIKKYKS